jgi:hypothetical protein
MTTYKTVSKLSKIDAAYIAGLVDGEGTVTLCRKHKNENRQLAVSISNTEREVLQYVLQRVGAGKITGKKTAKSHHTPSFTYAIYNRQALSLLEQLNSYLRTYKKQRADLILMNYLKMTPRNGKYGHELLAARHAFEEELLGIRAR